MSQKVRLPVPNETPPADPDFIFRPWITLRDYRRIYAKKCGRIAFKIPRRY